jgi:uncharacterized membrane protein
MANKLRYVGPGLLSLSGLTLALAWDRMPERWISHWGAHGRPDGFGDKHHPIEVFMPLLIGLFSWLVLDTIARLIERSGRVPELSRALALPVRLQAIGVAAIFAILAVALPLFQPQRPSAVAGVVLLLAFGPLGAGLVHYARVLSRMRRAGHPALAGWSGIVYRNRDDPRLFVPNLNGLGYTLNFGRPAAWLVLAMLLIPATVMAVLISKSR